MNDVFAEKIYADYLRRAREEIRATAGQKGLSFLPEASLETDFLPLLLLANSIFVGGEIEKSIYRSSALSLLYFGARIHRLSSPNEAHAILFGDYFYSLFMDIVCSKGDYALLEPLAELLCILSRGRLDRLDLKEKEALRKEYGSLGKTASLLGFWDQREGLAEDARNKLLRLGEILGMLWGKTIEGFEADLIREEEEFGYILSSLSFKTEKKNSIDLFGKLYHALKERRSFLL